MGLVAQGCRAFLRARPRLRLRMAHAPSFSCAPLALDRPTAKASRRWCNGGRKDDKGDKGTRRCVLRTRAPARRTAKAPALLRRSAERQPAPHLNTRVARMRGVSGRELTAGAVPERFAEPLLFPRRTLKLTVPRRELCGDGGRHDHKQNVGGDAAERSLVAAHGENALRRRDDILVPVPGVEAHRVVAVP